MGDVLKLFIPQMEELPDAGLSQLMVVDLNLNENLLHYLGDDLWMCQRLKVGHQELRIISKNFVVNYRTIDTTLSGVEAAEQPALHQQHP